MTDDERDDQVWDWFMSTRERAALVVGGEYEPYHGYSPGVMRSRDDWRSLSRREKNELYRAVGRNRLATRENYKLLERELAVT